MKQNILFDLDGTITDPFEGITKAVAYALRKFGIEISDRTQLRSFIGPPLRDSFMHDFSFSIEQADEAIRYYREYYSKTGIYECYVYDGIESLFSLLCEKGARIIMATSKPEPFAAELMRHFGLDSYFYRIVGASFDYSRARKTDVIGAAIEECAISDIGTAVMVGDREFDIRGAASFGMAGIGVSYGYGSREELIAAGAVSVCESVAQLKDVLLFEKAL